MYYITYKFIHCREIILEKTGIGIVKLILSALALFLANLFRRQLSLQ